MAVPFLSFDRSSSKNWSRKAFAESRNPRPGAHNPSSSDAFQLAKLTVNSIQFMHFGVLRVFAERTKAFSLHEDLQPAASG